MSAMVRTSCRPEGDGLLSWVDEEGNASGWLGHALLDNCLAYMNDVLADEDAEDGPSEA